MRHRWHETQLEYSKQADRVRFHRSNHCSSRTLNKVLGWLHRLVRPNCHIQNNRPMASSSIFRVPMFRNLAILHTKHVEPERLVVFTIPARPCLAHVDDNQIVFSNHIQ